MRLAVWAREGGRRYSLFDLRAGILFEVRSRFAMLPVPFPLPTLWSGPLATLSAIIPHG